MLSANNADVAKQYKILVILNPLTRTMIPYNIPLRASTAGYCHDNFALQYLHFPLKIRKLTSGTKSYHLICFPHDMQCERTTTTLCFSGILYMHTFRKLPIITPYIIVINIHIPFTLIILPLINYMKLKCYIHQHYLL